MTPLEGLRRALHAWPMALLLTAFSAVLSSALTLHDRMAAADLGLGGFPFNISNREYYQALSPAELSTLALFALAWVFLSGGIIDRLARGTRSSSRRFFAACGACFGPLIRLALLALATYAIVLIWIEPAMARASESMSEPARVTLFGALAMLLFAIALVFDYARIRLVIEDRRSAIGALAASFRMLRAYPGRMLAAQGLFWLALVIWMTLRAPLASDPAFALAYLLAAGEIFLKLALVATQAAIYQRVLASAGWVAREEARWPDDPSANPAAL